MLQLPASVLSEEHAPNLSDKYVHINSSEVIDMMTQEGFRLTSAKSGRTRSFAARHFAKHVLDFRLPDAPVFGDDEGEPRVLFINSHNGSTAAMAVAGFFRFVCTNGMIVGTNYDKVRSRHYGQQAHDLVRRMQDLARNTGPMFKQIDQWTKRQLSKSEQIDFARAASNLRFGDTNRFDIHQLLQVRRPEDEGDSLWRVFNRIQENATHGSLFGISRNGRRITSRPIESVNRDLSFNQRLWKLAEETAKT